MATRATINVDDERDRWRWTCPNGHRNWEPTNEHFWCQQCARLRGADAVFHELVDQRDGRTVARDEVRLETEMGSYRDVFGVDGAP